MGSSVVVVLLSIITANLQLYTYTHSHYNFYTTSCIWRKCTLKLGTLLLLLLSMWKDMQISYFISVWGTTVQDSLINSCQKNNLHIIRLWLCSAWKAKYTVGLFLWDRSNKVLMHQGTILETLLTIYFTGFLIIYI